MPDAGLHDQLTANSYQLPTTNYRASSSCHLLLRKTGSPKRVFKMFTLMKNYSSCHCQRLRPKPRPRPKSKATNNKLACSCSSLCGRVGGARGRQLQWQQPNSSQLMMDVDYDGRCRPTKKTDQKHRARIKGRRIKNRQKMLSHGEKIIYFPFHGYIISL